METVAPLLSPKPQLRAFQSAGSAGLTSDHSISVEANISRQKQMPTTAAPVIDRKRTATPSTASHPTKRGCRKSKHSTLQQLYLDLGQKDFDSTPCPTCGMLYQRGVEEEEHAHRTYHQRHFTTELMFPGWKNERVVKHFAENEKVVVVLSSDPKYQKRRVQDVKTKVDKELGCSEGMLSWCMCFLYIMEKRVIGFVLTERITQGCPVLTSDQVTEMSNKEDTAENKKSLAPIEEKYRPKLDSAAVYTSMTPVPAVVGISVLWVSSNHRRKNIATRMMDCVRHRWKEICRNLLSNTKFSCMDIVAGVEIR
ncbi:hypothetical protein EMCRGX_G034364 [Ephydatia muelleri]